MVLGPQVSKILQPAPPQLVSYNFVDIATGTGYVNYYAGTASGANVLSNFPFYSDSILSTNTITSPDYTGVSLDLDFTVLLNNPIDIKGNAIVDVPVGFVNIAGNSTAKTFIKAFIKKWDGVNPDVTLGGGSSSEWTTATTAGNWNYNIRTATIPITTVQHIKRGEYLRLTVEVWGKESVNAQNRIVAGHDPMNRSSQDGVEYGKIFASGASILKLQLPLRTGD